MGLGITGNVNKGFDQRFSIPLSIADEFTRKKLNKDIRDCLTNFDNDGSIKDFCFLGDPGGKSSEIAVFGDSHAITLLSAFDHIGKKIGKSIVFTGLGGCPSLLDVWVLKGNFATGICKNLVERPISLCKRS